MVTSLHGHAHVHACSVHAGKLYIGTFACLLMHELTKPLDVLPFEMHLV